MWRRFSTVQKTVILIHITSFSCSSEFPKSTTSQWCCVGLRFVDCQGHSSSVNALSTSRSQHEIIFDMPYYPAGSNNHTVVIKGWAWSATILRYPVMFKLCSVGMTGTKVLTPPHYIELLIQGKTDPCFQVVDIKHVTCEPVKIVASVSCS